ncbi:MAG: META domain-containing protein [Verrucomicrobiota bacterium]
MKQLHTRFILAFCIFAGLSSITHAEPVKETPATQADLAAVKEWRLTQIGDEAIAADAGVTLVFTEDSKLSGSGGVNRFGGKCELKADGQITIQNIFSTQMAALDENVMKREGQYFQLLGKAKRALLINGNLILECTDKDNKPIKLVFVAVKKD